MALTDKLKSIADGFRASRGISDELSLTQMAELAAVPLGIEEQLIAGAYPDYVRAELARVASKARQVITAESIVSICLSDSHYYDSENTRLAGLHAAMAIKGLTYLLPVDFIAHLGDVGNESSQTDTANLEQNILEMLGFVKEAAGKDIPVFAAIGNHDNGNYITSTDSTDMVDPAFLYQNFTALADSDDTVISGEDVGGYCYRDFPSKKLRVFLLNTGEGLVTGGASNDTGTSETQRAWFAAALQELNSKADAAEWMFMVLCHYPADYGAARPLSNLLAAYVNGTSITLNGTVYNFSGCNGAKFLVQHHGHIHNFLADRLYYGGTPVQYDGWRVGIPNSQYNRENYYGEFNGIQYAQLKDDGSLDSYPKYPGTAEDTSFVVNVCNPSEEKIYSFHYGAGYDRTISLEGIRYYSIQTSLTGATISGSSTTVQEGESYTGTVAASEGYELDSVVITMDGQDITEEVNADGTKVYENGSIHIQEVTGTVLITVEAVKQVSYTNLVNLAVDSIGASAPYTDNTYLSSSGSTGTLNGYATTGFIPIDGAAVHTYRIGGEGIAWNEYGARVAWYDASFAKKGDVMSYDKIGSNQFYPTVVEDANCAAAFATNINVSPPNGAAYFRISAKGKGENLIVTIDEPIE